MSEVKDTAVICTRCGKKISGFYYPINHDVWCYECINSVKKPAEDFPLSEDEIVYLKADVKALNEIRKAIGLDPVEVIIPRTIEEEIDSYWGLEKDRL